MPGPTSTPPSPPVSASTITKSTLNALLPRYDALLTKLSSSASSSPASVNTKPSTPDLQTLDHLRYTEIPHRLAARKKDAESIDGKEGGGGGGGGAYLEKAEVEDLVRWKLSVTPPFPLPHTTAGKPALPNRKTLALPLPYSPDIPDPSTSSSQANAIRRSHGTFRPRLTQLVASNGAASVRDTTRRAFAIYAGEGDEEEGGETYVSAIKTLATLKGIGPATASLLLAVYDPARVPFFADELFWWVCCGGEWGTGIKYTVGEYKALWEGVRGVRGRLNIKGEGEGEGVRAVELEKAAWVLGWEARGGGGGGGRRKKGGVQVAAKREKEVATEQGTKKRKSANKSRADVESGPDDERELENVYASTPSSPAPPDPPDENLNTSVPSSIPEPNRPISPPPKRQPSNANASRTKSKPTADRPLRRSKRTKLS